MRVLQRHVRQTYFFSFVLFLSSFICAYFFWHHYAIVVLCAMSFTASWYVFNQAQKGYKAEDHTEFFTAHRIGTFYKQDKTGYVLYRDPWRLWLFPKKYHVDQGGSRNKFSKQKVIFTVDKNVPDKVATLSIIAYSKRRARKATLGFANKKGVVVAVRRAIDVDPTRLFVFEHFYHKGATRIITWPDVESCTFLVIPENIKLEVKKLLNIT